jgi:hypothetical protein
MRQQMRAFLTLLCVILSAEIAVCQKGTRTGCGANLRPTDTGTTAKESIAKPYWTVKYLDADSWLRIAYVPRGAITEKNNLLITVHADQIVSVGYSAKGEGNSDRIQGPRSGCSYARAMMPNLARSHPQSMVVFDVVPRLASRLEEKLDFSSGSTRMWIEERKQERMNVDIIDCEYESFIEDLHWLLGTRWNEVAHDLTK